MASAPIFAATPRCSAVSISTAAANNRTGTSASTIFTAGSSGSRIEEVRMKAQGTTTAGTVRFYVHNGTSFFILTEQAYGANTVSGSNPSLEYTIQFTNLILPSGYSLRANIESGTWDITAFGGDF
jgi:hypothetical protein